MKLRCSCGGTAALDIDMPMPERDAHAVKFYEHHSQCREAGMTQAHAIADIAKTFHDIFALIEGLENERDK